MEIVGRIMGFIVMIAIFVIILAMPVKWLWNDIMPDLFGLPQIDFWKALGIVALTRIMFGTGFSSPNKD